MFIGNSLPDTALRYVLESLVPYSHANITLAFRPNAFFNELARIDAKQRYSRSTLRAAYYHAKREKLVAFNTHNGIELTEAGKDRIKPWQPDKLIGSHVMVIFDIPEQQRGRRNQLRTLLRELQFVPIQKSVWTSKLDCAHIIVDASRDLQISSYVQVYECAKIT